MLYELRRILRMPRWWGILSWINSDILFCECYISQLSEKISNDLDNSNTDQLIQDLIALSKLPNGNNIIMNLTEDPKGLDYDHLRSKLLTDADRVIEHINKNIFGY